MAVADKVKSIIVEQLGVDEEEVTPDASFVDDLGATRRMPPARGKFHRLRPPACR